jgi:hypothetical protein
MKKLFSFGLMLFLVALIGCAGVQPVKQEDLTIKQVVEVPGFTKHQIYDCCKIWVAENFRSAKAVIEHDDRENCCLIGNGIIKYPCHGLECIAKGDWQVHFTMRIDTKDGKFRQTFSNLQLSWPARMDSLGYHSAYRGPINTQGDLDRIKPALLEMANQIKFAMGQEKVKEDW